MVASRLLISCVFVAIAAPAFSASLDGLWSFGNSGNCSRDIYTDGMPLEISGAEWDGYESACTVLSKRNDHVRFACIGEGSEWQMTATVRLSGDTLTVTEGGHTTTYKRCK